MKTLESADTTLINKPNTTAHWLKVGLCSIVIAASLLQFAYNGVLRSASFTPDQYLSADFPRFYAAGQLWNEGRDPYNYTQLFDRLAQVVGLEKAQYSPSGYYYPPQASVLFGWFGSLSLNNAQYLMLALNLILLVASLWMLAHIMSWYRPVGLFELTLIISLLNTGFARNNVREGQTGLWVCVPLLGAFILAYHGRKTLGGLALSILSFKPSFLPLYLLYFFIKKSYKMVIICVVVSAVLTITPLLLTQRPLVDTTTTWVKQLGTQSAPGSTDDPGPFVLRSATMHHLTPLVFRILNSQSTLASAVSWLLILALVGFGGYLMWRSRPSAKGELLDFSLVSALSLFALYHRNYDIFLLFPGFIYMYLHAMNSTSKAAQRNWLVFLVFSVAVHFLPSDAMLQLSYRFTNLPDNYLFRVLAPFQTWAGLAVLGALLWLKWSQRKADLLSEKAG